MGGGRCRFKTSYSGRLKRGKGGNILRACDGECEAGANLPCKPDCSTFGHETSSLNGTARRTSSLSSCLHQGAKLERSGSKLTAQTYQSCKEPSYMSWICSVRLHETCRLISLLPQLNQKFNYIYRLLASLIPSCNSIRLHVITLPFGLYVCSSRCNLAWILESPGLPYCLQLAGGSCMVLWRGCIMTSSREVMLQAMYRVSLKSPLQNNFTNLSIL